MDFLTEKELVQRMDELLTEIEQDPNKSQEDNSVLSKENALKKLEERRTTAPKRIRNQDLNAGDPMTFYCRICGYVSDVVGEDYQPSPGYPAKICSECEAMEEKGWLE